MSNGFHACDSFEHMTGFMGYDWLTGCWEVTHTSQLMDFALWLTMSHRGLCKRGVMSHQG